MQRSDLPGGVEFIARDQNGGVILILVDDRPWDGSTERAIAVQERLNATADYLISGAFVRDHPDLDGLPTRIELRCVHAPDAVTTHLLSAVQAVFREHAISLVVKQFRQAIH